MKKRIANIIASSAGGTASKAAKTYKISLPSAWLNEMGLTGDSASVELKFDGEKICISKRLNLVEFLEKKKKLGHKLLLLYYYDAETLCSTVCADYSDETLAVEDSVSDPIRTAFGNNKLALWEDYLAFLEDRCVPRGRDGLQWYLTAIGTDSFEPLEIIKKTSGRMAEDNQWIRLEEVE